MDVESFHNYCLTKRGTEACFPFDEQTLVFKVMGKIYAILPLDDISPRANLKADPDYSIELREKYHQIIPGYHMNKKHWNTVSLEEGLENEFITELIDQSYALVVAKLPGKLKNELNCL